MIRAVGQLVAGWVAFWVILIVIGLLIAGTQTEHTPVLAQVAIEQRHRHESLVQVPPSDSRV